MALWEVQGKTFVVTGGASGMGSKYPGIFLEQGAKSVAILDIAEEQGKKVAELYNKTYPGQVTFIKCDMTKEDDITKAFAEVVAKFKQVDVIINNAGLMLEAPTLWRTTADVNFQGPVSLTMKGLDHMDTRNGGAGGIIVNVSSIWALMKVHYVPIYCATKIAVMHFSQCISMSPFFENTGVRVLCICFGGTDTPMATNLEKCPYDPRLGKGFADAVLYLQKPESAAAAVDYMLKNAPPGSIWLSIDDKPVKNITAVVDQAFTMLENEVFGNTQ